MIFVFGSNKEGHHNGGAAAYALQKQGAVMGVGEGMQGNSYGLPTCYVNKKIGMISTLQFSEVKKYIRRFLRYAKEHPELRFQVTAVGCGIAGFKHAQIAPLFKEATANCFFDALWDPWLGKDKNYWGTF